MSLQGALSIAAGGLSNIASQMAVVSNNIANAATPDYAVEVGTQTSLVAGSEGFGVFTGPVVRQINLQLQQETLQQSSVVSNLQTQQSALSNIDAVQGTPGAGTDLSSLVGSLQSAFTTLQSDPSNSTSQTGVVTAAEGLTAQINTLSNAYTTVRQTAETNLETSVTTLNTTLSTMANLTSQIVEAKANGQSTADLENQRDVAINTLSGLIGVTFINQSNGGLIANTAGGLSIQIANPLPQFSMSPSSVAPQTYYPNGGISGIMMGNLDVTNQLTGGSIGANVTLRDSTMPAYQAELDEFSNTLSNRFSAQGLQLFTPTTTGVPVVPPAVPAQSGYIGVSAIIAVNPTVIADPSEVTNGNLTIPATGTGSTGAAAFTPNPSTGPASFDTLISNVLNYSFGNDVQAGVSQVAPNMSGLGPTGTIAAPYSTPETIAAFATNVVASQSGDVATTTSNLSTAQAVQTSLATLVTSGSGVNTDTQMSNLVGLQNSYGANARVIGAVQDMWTALLASVNP